MFSFKVDDQIEIELLQQQHKDELFTLVDSNRDHLRYQIMQIIMDSIGY
jgi:ribosomal-protein-serine acetyltransferase